MYAVIMITDSSQPSCGTDVVCFFKRCFRAKVGLADVNTSIVFTNMFALLSLFLSMGHIFLWPNRIHLENIGIFSKFGYIIHGKRHCKLEKWGNPAAMTLDL